MPGHYDGPPKPPISRSAFDEQNTEDAAGKKPMYRHEKGHCPPGHYWNGKKCVQKTVGP